MIGPLGVFSRSRMAKAPRFGSPFHMLLSRDSAVATDTSVLGSARQRAAISLTIGWAPGRTYSPKATSS